MVFVCRRHVSAAAALALLCYVSPGTNATTITSAASPTPTILEAPTCEFRTINYITASLPQQCLRSAWSSANSTSTKFDPSEYATTTNEGVMTTASGIPNQEPTPNTTESDTQQHESSASNDPTSSTSIPIPSPTETGQPSSIEADGGELNEAAFLSFEEWKKQTLENAGQANTNIGNKKSSGPGQNNRNAESIQSNFDSLGEEGEIELDFGAFQSGHKGKEAASESQTGDPDNRQDSQTQDDSRKQKNMHRSKDAGKTYKERFSYASFDGGATILKTHPGAKNAKAVLVENKDSYMLSECAAEDKFLIIELSEDIWIDTLVLANYEFFSSMVRTFRVSVSDRYPVKMDKWKDLGTYEARNSREIQAFLIENPQIWARYIRIEFLSHYGNEYYCPLSLVRVHGTRMLESWKESEAIGDEDDSEDSDEQEIEEHFVPDAVALVVQEEEKLNAELKEAQAAIHNPTKASESNTLEAAEATPNPNCLTGVGSCANDESLHGMTDPWIKQDSLVDIFDRIYFSSQASIMCQVAEAPTGSPDSDSIHAKEASDSSTTELQNSTTTASSSTDAISNPTPVVPTTNTITDSSTVEKSSDSESTPASTQTQNITSSSHAPDAAMTASITSKQQSIASSQKNKTSTTTSSAASPLPTIQESFFKAVSRRLQLLESNSTLSLKYIEEQSRILREAFTKVEKRQLQKTDTFLDTLNSTVLEQLQGFRQQYDEIWQSTVISLESQREESKREILAVSTRLNILADEVVFQKRMSIVQSVLLLLCLGLIIFSRVSAGGGLEFSGMQTRTRNSVFHNSPADSPLDSPSLRRSGSMGNDEQWLDLQDGRPETDEYHISRLQSRHGSLPTPITSYTRSENDLTSPSRDNPLMDPSSNPISNGSDYLEPATQPTTINPRSMVWRERNDNLESAYLSPSSRGVLRRRDGLVKPQSDPLEGGMRHDSAASSQVSLERRIWLGPELRDEDGSQHLPSPPPEGENEETGHSIARKPLPALPQHDS